MRGTNKLRALLLSGATILLCLTVIVGMTFVLFTDKQTVKNHLKAGDLDITLTRTKLVSTYLDRDGYLATFTDTEEKDFSRETDENIFALDGALIVPRSEYVATMKVANNSDVAFAYWIEIVYTGEPDVELADQIRITIDTAKGKLISDGLMIGSEEEPVAILGIGDSHEFSATLEFLDLENAINNAAQGDGTTFDLIVHAVQYTEDVSQG